MVKKKIFQAGGDKEAGDIETSENKDNTSVQEAKVSDSAGPGTDKEPQEGRPEPESAAREEADKRKDEERVLLEKLAEMQDRYLRLSAEFDNYRKRTLKEKMDMRKLKSNCCITETIF